jgi:hypothetical protein
MKEMLKRLAGNARKLAKRRAGGDEPRSQRIRAAHGAQRSKRGRPLTPLRSVRGSDGAYSSAYGIRGRIAGAGALSGGGETIKT